MSTPWVLAYVVTNVIAFLIGWTYGLDIVYYLIDNPWWGVLVLYLTGVISGVAIRWYLNSRAK